MEKSVGPVKSAKKRKADESGDSSDEEEADKDGDEESDSSDDDSDSDYDVEQLRKSATSKGKLTIVCTATNALSGTYDMTSFKIILFCYFIS